MGLLEMMRLSVGNKSKVLRYVVEFQDTGRHVYADRAEAMAAQTEDWRREYAKTSGLWEVLDKEVVA